MDQNTDCSKLTAQGCNEGMSYMSQKLRAVISNLLEHIPEYSHDKSKRAKKFIITHQFTQPADLEYQTSVKRHKNSAFSCCLGSKTHQFDLFCFIFMGEFLRRWPQFFGIISLNFFGGSVFLS